MTMSPQPPDPHRPYEVPHDGAHFAPGMAPVPEPPVVPGPTDTRPLPLVSTPTDAAGTSTRARVWGALAALLALALCAGATILGFTAGPDADPVPALPGAVTPSPSTVTPSAKPVTPAATAGLGEPGRPARTSRPAKPAAKPPAKAKRKKQKTAPAGEVLYASCADVRAAGAAPIRRGDPGYSRRLDRDGDGVGCE